MFESSLPHMNKSEAVLATVVAVLAATAGALAGYVVGVGEGREARADAMRKLERKI